MTFIFETLLRYLEPFSSGILCLAVLFLMPLLLDRSKPRILRILIIPAAAVAFWLLYRHVAASAPAARWLGRLNSPLFPAMMILVLPAVYLSRGRLYKLFLLLPAAFLVLAGLAVVHAYRGVPPGSGGFYWLLIRPSFLMAGAVSLAVLAQPLASLKNFRRVVRVLAFIVLMYGGFMFRQDYTDYKEMLGRRATPARDVMTISETTPVVREADKLLHLPGAPCRFSADGGYVQGCNMELWQRVMQASILKVRARDVGETNALACATGSVALLLVLSFAAARWWCGWICPLSSMGDALNGLRRLAGLPHLKPAEPVKLGMLLSGLSMGTLGMALAKCYPYLDGNGEFMGCKIPIYPFCKICPGQQICPVASRGPAGLQPLPGWDWLFGFFRVAVIAMVVLFLVSFLGARRLWCRFCPMGMISGFFNRGGMVRLRKIARKCNHCGVCAEVCPMDIDTVRSEMIDENVGSFHCVLCLKCVEKCPRDGCLVLELAGGKVTESRFDGKAK